MKLTVYGCAPRIGGEEEEEANGLRFALRVGSSLCAVLRWSGHTMNLEVLGSFLIDLCLQCHLVLELDPRVRRDRTEFITQPIKRQEVSERSHSLVSVTQQ